MEDLEAYYNILKPKKKMIEEDKDKDINYTLNIDKNTNINCTVNNETAKKHSFDNLSNTNITKNSGGKPYPEEKKNTIVNKNDLSDNEIKTKKNSNCSPVDSSPNNTHENNKNNINSNVNNDLVDFRNSKLLDEYKDFYKKVFEYEQDIFHYLKNNKKHVEDISLDMVKKLFSKQ